MNKNKKTRGAGKKEKGKIEKTAEKPSQISDDSTVREATEERSSSANSGQGPSTSSGQGPSTSSGQGPSTESEQNPLTQQKVFLKSFSDYIIVAKDKILIVALLVIIFNPIPGGVIVSFGLLSQKETKKEGKWFLPLTLFWGAISLSTTLKYFSQSL